MKYIIPQDKIQKLVFRYLDMQYGDLETYKHEYAGFIFKKPNDDYEYGIMSWDKKYRNLYIYYKLIEEISSMFSIEKYYSMEIIGKWVGDRYKLNVVRTYQTN